MRGKAQQHFNLLMTPRFDYVVRDATCVAVIDRDTGRWLGSHVALGCTMSLVQTTEPRNGAHWDVQMTTRQRDLRLGPLLGLEKPSPAVIQHLTRSSVHGAA